MEYATDVGETRWTDVTERIVSVTALFLLSSTVLQLCWGGILISTRDPLKLTRMDPIKVIQ